jgi:hypothetical protein
MPVFRHVQETAAGQILGVPTQPPRPTEPVPNLADRNSDGTGPDGDAR